MSDGGYWIDSPDNPFNQMSYTRGGGGYDNSSTQASNDARAFAMQGAGASALPHFATAGVAQKVLPPGSLAVVGDNVVKTTGPGSSSASTKGGSGGAGAGSSGAASVASGGGGKGAGSQLVIAAPGGGKKMAPAKSLSGGDGPRYLDMGTWPVFGPLTWEVGPGFVDAQDVEDIYGDDIFSWPALAAKSLHDAAINAQRMSDAAVGQVSTFTRSVVDGYQSWPVATPFDDVPDPTSYRPMSVW